MQLNLFYQGLIFLVFFTFIQCENQEKNIEIKKKEYIKSSHNVLQNGRIVSKSVNQPIPVDQAQPPVLQQDDTNKNAPKYIARGDILVPIDEIELSGSKRSKRKVIAETNNFGGSNRWPRGVVPYDFVSGIDYRVQQNVLSAIQHWHQRTCIRFEPYNYQRHRDIGAKITIDDSGSGCATFVGYRSPSSGLPPSYSVYLPIVCPLGSAIHELGHVIGFYHEMARTDRDQEINLYFNLMSSSEATQYDIMPNPMPGYYGQPYDLSSIMHYYPTDVMAARDSRRTFLMGQRLGLSFLDSKLANLAYHCSDKCNSKPVCENEGYVNQNCQCSCADGFYGDRCNLLQGYLLTSRVLPPDTESSVTTEEAKPQTNPSTPTPVTKKTETSTQSSIHWLEWSDWSNCSESCGSGVRVRTRLCSSTDIDGSSEPCSSLGGDSFEIESCQHSECKQNDIIMSCTFDLPNEKCPLNDKNNWQIQDVLDADQVRPITDHTRGDGKYLIIIGNITGSDDLQKFELGPFTKSKDSDETNHCLQFWYSAHGQGLGDITIHRDNQNDDIFTFHKSNQDTNWKQIQRTIPNDKDYKLIFSYQSITSEYNHIAIDDISIINGACPSNIVNNQRRRKRRQTTTGCSSVIDLTTSNTVASITSPNYPNFYPSNSQCYYFIRAPQYYRIILQFTDFNVPTNDQNSCYDTIEIRYYNLGQNGPRYCGTGANTNNLRFVSSKNYIMIVFRSDQSYSGRGFRAQATLGQ